MKLFQDKVRGRWLGLVALVLGLGAGCGEDEPTGLGRGLRTPPDTLHLAELAAVAMDTVFPIPVSLGSSPVGQLGRKLAYTTHILLAFDVPTRVVQGADTLRLDTATLILRTDSLLAAPFRGALRLGLHEVAAAGRGWAPESILARLPPLEPDPLALDVVLADSAVIGRVTRIRYDVQLARIDGYAAARDSGKTLAVNVAVVFEGFAGPGGDGLLEIPFRRPDGTQTPQFIGFSNARTEAITTVAPVRRLPVVEFDSTYAPGTKLVVSDGYRMHSYLRFVPLRRVLPARALVHLAELVLTQADSASGTSFGDGPALGVIVPPDTTTIFATATNKLPAPFTAPLVAFAGATTAVRVTAYAFSLQEGTADHGLILRLTNEGTKVRHFEFHGGAAPDSLRPRLRIVYSLPAPFEGGER